jgi:uncharacterized protein
MPEPVPDPRPRAGPAQGGVVPEGVRCTACGYAAAFTRPRCPVCGAGVAPAAFGPEGTVWSATVVRVAVPGRNPPYGLAYVDLDDGPRILAHTPGDVPVQIGSRVRLVAGGGDGDVAVTVAPA